MGTKIGHSEVKDIEKIMNAKSHAWARIMGIGKKWNHEASVKEAVSVTGLDPPPLYSLRKDHKPVVDGEDPKMRGVCGGNKGPISRISNILSDIITPHNEEFQDDSQLESTEDLQAKLEGFNVEEVEGDLEIYSMDATALYPSLEIKRTAEYVMEIMTESKLEIKSVDYGELGRYLAYITSEEEVVELGLEEVIAKRRKKGSRKPTITGPELMKSFAGESEVWVIERRPNELEKRLMLALAVSKDVEEVLTNHVFTFTGEVFKQIKGGAIGNEPTCVIAKTRTICLIRDFKRKVEVVVRNSRKIEEIEAENGETKEIEMRIEFPVLKIYVAKMYVDDTTLITGRIEKGWRYKEGRERMIWKTAWEEEEEIDGVKGDKKTALEFKKIVNEVEKDIQMTIDVPSNHLDGKIPVLDLKVWMEKSEEDKNKVKFIFYP